MSFIRVSTADDVKWSDDTLFQGAVVLKVKLPDTYSELHAKQTTLRRSLPRPLPRLIVIPIINGYLRDNRILPGPNLTPPNVRFTSSWYDAENKLIADESDLFSIPSSSDASYEITVPTLTAPDAPA